MTLAAERPDERDVLDLLAMAGRRSQGISIDDCPGGGNNRVYRVTAGTDQFLVKWYFTHPSDTRDRLHAEYTFLQYAYGLGGHRVPEPLAALPERRLALYEFVPGTKLTAGDIRAKHVDQAAAFLCALNGPDRLQLGAALPEASEACFSIAAHLDAVRGRVARLSDIPGTSAEDDEARRLAAEIARLLDRHTGAIAEDARSRGLDPDAALPRASRCVSPSDFGFHNVLVRSSGELCFLDFEYAGWDDPAKMVNDFFWQPAVPVSREYQAGFLERCVQYADDPQALIVRSRMLAPLFGIKWCCIVLNEFLPAAARRRRFASPDPDPGDRKRAQIVKARRLIDSLSG